MITSALIKYEEHIMESVKYKLTEQLRSFLFFSPSEVNKLKIPGRFTTEAVYVLHSLQNEPIASCETFQLFGV